MGIWNLQSAHCRSANVAGSAPLLGTDRAFLLEQSQGEWAEVDRAP